MSLYYKDEWNMVYLGEALEVLKTLPGESVNCCITSPPYWNLRDYQVEGQLGLEKTFGYYIHKLCSIYDEVKRVLTKDGTCWVIIGDTYSDSGGSGKDQTVHKQFGKVQKRNKYSVGTPPHTTKELPPKSLCQIPSRFAIEMCNRGWILRNKIIWYKKNCMPSSVKDRFTVDFECIYFFVKNRKYYFEQQLEKTLTKDNSNRDRDNSKLNNTPGRSRMAGLKINNYNYKNKRTVWQVNPKPYSEAHFAVYPPELIEPCIKAGCPEGGVILDPFAGSGTTGASAKLFRRKSILIELNSEYCKLITNRIQSAIPGDTVENFSKTKPPKLRLF